MKLLTLAALIATAATLQGCEFGRHSSTEAFFTAMGADPLPGVLADDPVPAPIVVADITAPEVAPPVTTPDSEPVVVPVVVPPPPPPPPLQYGDPGYVAKYNEKGYTGPLPCPESRFRILTCDDDGVSWHWLDSNMNWIE